MYVLMITPNNFPEGDAGAVRDWYYSRIYHELGYEIVHIGMNPNCVSGEYKGVTYRSLYVKNNGFLKKLTNRFTYKKRLEDITIEVMREKGLPELIHIYDIPKQGIEWAIKQTKKYSIPVVHDSVEWFSPCEFAMGRFAYPYILKDRCNRYYIRKPIAVFAISTYLENYFRNKGLKTLRIPIIMDKKDYIPKEKREYKKIQIAYAGSPAKKDYLKECINGFCSLPDEQKEKFEFNILGVDEKQIEPYCNKNIPKEIIAHGRVPREKVIELLSWSDFSILLRPADERYAQAGFPTKSVEAMMNGCVLLCNLTSDLGLYLENEKNAIFISDSTAGAVTEALKRIAELSRDEIEKMKKNARLTAEEYFDYRKYIWSIKKFIEDIKEN